MLMPDQPRFNRIAGCLRLSASGAELKTSVRYPAGSTPVEDRDAETNKPKWQRNYSVPCGAARRVRGVDQSEPVTSERHAY